MTRRLATRVVLDTNVVVSAFLKPASVPASILRIILSGRIELAYDVRIINEYREVLARPRIKLDHNLVKVVIEGMTAAGAEVLAVPLSRELPDPDDEPFLEVAAAAGRGVPLVTGNVRHFPKDYRHGVPVVTPDEWLEHWRRS